MHKIFLAAHKHIVYCTSSNSLETIGFKMQQQLSLGWITPDFPFFLKGSGYPLMTVTLYLSYTYDYTLVLSTFIPNTYHCTAKLSLES